MAGNKLKQIILVAMMTSVPGVSSAHIPHNSGSVKNKTEVNGAKRGPSVRNKAHNQNSVKKIEWYMPSTEFGINDIVLIPDYVGKNMREGVAAHYENSTLQILYDSNTYSNDKSVGMYTLDSPEFICTIRHEFGHMIDGVSLEINRKNLSAYQNAIVDWARETKESFLDKIASMNMWTETVTPEKPCGDTSLVPNVSDLRKKVQSGEFTAKDWKETEWKQAEVIESFAKASTDLNDDYIEQHLSVATSIYSLEKTQKTEKALAEGKDAKQEIFDAELRKTLEKIFAVKDMHYNESAQKIVLSSDYTDLYPTFKNYVENICSTPYMEKTFEKIPAAVRNDVSMQENAKNRKPFRWEKLIEGIKKKIEKWGFNPFKSGSKELEEFRLEDAKKRKLDNPQYLTPTQMKEIVTKCSKLPGCMDKYSSRNILMNELQSSNISAKETMKRDFANYKEFNLAYANVVSNLIEKKSSENAASSLAKSVYPANKYYNSFNEGRS